MPGSKSDYLENTVLNLILGAVAYTPPVTVYIALYTAAPTDAAGGTEVTGGSYARKSMTNNAVNFPAAVNGAKSNGTDIIFATATVSWGTVLAFGILDAATAGNLLYWGTLALSKIIGPGDTAKFSTGDLDITED